jgi:hypothetical protein
MKGRSIGHNRIAPYDIGCFLYMPSCWTCFDLLLNDDRRTIFSRQTQMSLRSRGRWRTGPKVVLRTAGHILFSNFVKCLKYENICAGNDSCMNLATETHVPHSLLLYIFYVHMYVCTSERIIRTPYLPQRFLRLFLVVSRHHQQQPLTQSTPADDR